LCFLYGWRLKRPWLNLIFGVFTLGIWFSAVYTGHHYLIDVLGGLMVAVTGYTIFEYLSEQTKLKTWFENFVQKI
jgi:membrane-associated phospholipid phosphatase